MYPTHWCVSTYVPGWVCTLVLNLWRSPSIPPHTATCRHDDAPLEHACVRAVGSAARKKGGRETSHARRGLVLTYVFAGLDVCRLQGVRIIGGLPAYGVGSFQGRILDFEIQRYPFVYDIYIYIFTRRIRTDFRTSVSRTTKERKDTDIEFPTHNIPP